MISNTAEKIVQKSRPRVVVGKLTLANMKGVNILVALTFMMAYAELVEAQLECEVPGECVGQLVGFVDEDDPVR